MNITAEEIITELSMSYSHSMHLIVEGNTDLKLFQSLFESPSEINIIDACGSDVVVDSLKLAPQAKLQNPRMASVLGIIDRDYRLPCGFITPSPDLLLSDLRDVECMMIASPAFESVLSELGSPAKIAAFGGKEKVRHTLFDVCRPLASLRYISRIQNINFSFKKIDFEKFVEKRSMVIDESKLISHLSGLQAVGGPRPTSSHLADAKAVCASSEHPAGVKYFTSDLLLLRGHDVMTALGLGLRILWGSLTAAESTCESVERHFRLAFLAHLPLTTLYTSLISWLTANGLSPKVRVRV